MSRAGRSNLSHRTRNASRVRNIADQLSTDEEEISREQRRVSMALLRASQTQEERQATNETALLTMIIMIIDLNRVAFHYNCTIDCNSHPSIQIGPMEVVCNHCGALKFAGETPGLCCLSGKVILPPLPVPQEPLYSLLRGETLESRHFLSNTQQYNGCFQMTSFGADIINEHGFNPTFKSSTLQIQGQIPHRIGSLLPLEDAQHKFLQMYFMGNVDNQLDQRQTINTAMRRPILRDLQQLLHEHHALVRLFKTALDRMPNDDYKILIRADKRPAGTHERQFNAPTIDEVAVVIVLIRKGV